MDRDMLRVAAHLCISVLLRQLWVCPLLSQPKPQLSRCEIKSFFPKPNVLWYWKYAQECKWKEGVRKVGRA